MTKFKSVQVGTKSPDSSSNPETINGAISPSFVASVNGQPPPLPAKITRVQVVGALYNWAAWIFIMVMVFSQFLGIVWNTVETNLHDVQGRPPALGASVLQGTGDEPYADRVFACVEEGRYYKPVQLSELIGSGATQVDDTTGSSVNGYRIVEPKVSTLRSSMLDSYTDVCALIATTMDAIFDSCASLGYNVTQDSLRVLDGINSKTTLLIPNSLPVVAMPFADNSLDMRFAIPGYDGNACMFRLLGKYLDKTKTGGVFRGVDRSIRASKTAEWLGRPGGMWKNGWYEDPTGVKWYSDVMSSDQKSAYGVPQRQFDTLKHKELDCISTEACKDPAVVEAWGAKFTTTIQTLVANSITISNGERFGVYFNEVYQHRAIQSIYDWETLISNMSLGLLLGRWMFAMYALQNGYFRGESRWYNAGIGCLASSRSFNMLPIVLLPRLKITLSAFWSVGCEFDGAQKALSEAWFVVYPAILELMLLQFSLLNIFAKIARRRISDSPFGPSVVFFCILHWLRMDIAKPGSFFGINGRVTPILTSGQFEDLRLLDYFTSKAPLHLNGNIHSLIAIKLVVIGLNFIPLLLTKSTDALLNGPNGEVIKPIGIEKALAIRACKVGGLGRPLVYDRAAVSVAPAKKTDAINEWSGINSYELVRLGYLVYGGTFLISFEDWESLTFVAPFQRFYYLWNNRVTLFTLRDEGDGVKAASEKPHMSRLDDPRLQGLRWWKVVGRPVRLRGRLYKPAQFSSVLEEQRTVLVDPGGSVINGKRESADLDYLSNSQNLLLLPVVLITRLEQTLAAFFAVGCLFEGEQVVFTEAWFVIYPGVVEFVLLYFSLLNLLARLLHRRMTDTFFDPTLIFLCLLHILRVDIAQSQLFGIDGCVSTVFSASEFEQLKLLDLFSFDIALGINGNVHSLVVMKLDSVSLNLIPLLFSASTSIVGSSVKRVPPRQIEKTLAIRACYNEGLGRSSFQYDTLDVFPHPDAVFSSYVLLRLGYLVLGDKFLVSIIGWVYYSIVARLSRSQQPSSFCVLLIEVTAKGDGYEIAKAPAYFRENDPKLQRVRF